MPHYARPMEIHSRRVDRSCRKARLQTAVQRLTHLIIITKAWLQKCSHAFLLHKAQPTALRRLPSPSDCHPHRKKPPHIGMRQWRGASPSQKNAEVRLYKTKKEWNPASRWIPFLKKSYTPYFVNFKTVLSLNFNT